MPKKRFQPERFSARGQEERLQRGSGVLKSKGAFMLSQAISLANSQARYSEPLIFSSIFMGTDILCGRPSPCQAEPIAFYTIFSLHKSTRIFNEIGSIAAEAPV